MLEDEVRDAELVEHALMDGGFRFLFRRVETEVDFLRELHGFHPGVILSDHGLPAFDGFTALSLAQSRLPEVPFIFVTGSLGEEMAIKALKSGAADFVLKHHLAALPSAVHRALRQVEFRVQRKLAEEALAASEERYRSLVELSPDALFVESQEKFVFINTAGIRLLGARHRRDLVGKQVLDFVHPDDRTAVQERLRRLHKQRGLIPFKQQRIVRLDGVVVDVEMAAASLQFEGKSAAQVILHDITDRERAEREIRRLNVELEQRVADRTMELEAANKELEAFSYSVSHDLRAPLRHIEGFVEILRADKELLLEEGTRRHLETIADSARQMGRLIDDLLAFSRSARGEMRKTKVDLAELVEMVVDGLRQQTSGRPVEWVLRKLPTAEGDPALLQQVFVNLISNALKYTRTRKQPRIEIGSRKKGGELVVYVKDNGVGFDMRYAHKLFGVFQRLHRAAEFEGTGVGLANVRRIIHRHGGGTWAESVPGKGATFYFSLPVSAGKSSAPRPTDS